MGLNPDRKKEINGHLIEEFYWHGEYLIYVDSKLVNISFTHACELAAKEPGIEDGQAESSGDSRYMQDIINRGCSGYNGK